MSDSRVGLVPEKQLILNNNSFDHLTHYLFRYPAKFHPPIVRTLINQYTKHGDYILDPFCGSGSALIEAAIAGRHAIGSDIDPLAVFISRIKTHRYNIKYLTKSYQVLSEKLDQFQSKNVKCYEPHFQDLTLEEFNSTVHTEKLWIPAIPKLFHWFRRYVVVDLARINKEIAQIKTPNSHRDFFRLCFASIIRAASNADPVPVSGLEVTSYMKRKEILGRVVNPYALFEKAVKKGLLAVNDFKSKSDPKASVSAVQGNALKLKSFVRHKVDAVITSPPYHNAVDYYRRHQLEMFWLGFVKTQEDRLSLKPAYIGASRVSRKNSFLRDQHDLGPFSQKWEMQIRTRSPERANAFRHYVVSMRKVFDELGKILPHSKPAIFVVGHSSWNGLEIPTSDLFIELANPWFELTDYLWYPIKNRYMSYSRHNKANIDKEYVLVFHRTASI